MGRASLGGQRVGVGRASGRAGSRVSRAPARGQEVGWDAHLWEGRGSGGTCACEKLMPGELLSAERVVGAADGGCGCGGEGSGLGVGGPAGQAA